jgi:trans-aconitate methyltransferase
MYFDMSTKEIPNDQSIVIDTGCGGGLGIKYLVGRYKKFRGLDTNLTFLGQINYRVKTTKQSF